MKFKINQLVILARPENTLHMKGALGRIVELPDPTRIFYFPDRYMVDYPDYPEYSEVLNTTDTIYFSAERMLDPVDDSDNRIAEDESNLIFNPKRIKSCV